MPNLNTLHPDQKFAQLSNESIDDLPTLNAIGYLAILLRHEDGWVPSLDKIVATKKTGRDAARAARRELVRKGYYVKVQFKYDGGLNASDIWRSIYPHTAEDLDLIASYYRRGATWQVPEKDEDGNNRRDARGRTLMRPVTVQWAQMESWRGDKDTISDPEPEPEVEKSDEDDEEDETAGQSRGTENRPPGPAAPPEPGGGKPTPGSPPPGEPAPGHPTAGSPPPKEKTSENPSENTEEKTTEPFGDTQKVPNLQKVYVKTAGHSAYGETKQGEFVSNHLHAHARNKAGAAAVEAVQANPAINESELAKVIRHEQPDLSWGQAFGRAAALLAHERRDTDSTPPEAAQSA